MPFVTKEHRENPDPSIPGDLCYLAYRKMVDEWKLIPRWTTADRLYREMIIEPRLHDAMITDGHSQRLISEVAAVELAWQVFFVFHILPYEEEKRELNGDIE